MATYAIGDIQGCLQPLMRLLETVSFNSEHDQLLLAGDLVNRGPQSLETLRFLKSLGTSVTSVLGNHDLHLLCVAYGYQSPHPKDTLDSVFNANDKVELLEWLRHQPLALQHQHYTLTHAGVPHIWSTSETLKHAQEVERVLQSDEHIHTYLKNMYGNTPNCWNKELTHADRWRTITNYLTRMRICQSDGTLDFTYKSTLENFPNHFRPWFQHSNQLQAHEKILFGHWAALEGITHQDFAIALDTGCIWGGKLTAYCLDNQKTFSVSA